MKFLSFGLVALSTLFAASSAAPTTPGQALSHPAELPKAAIDTIAVRDEHSEVYNKISTTLVEVKKHTAKINSTSGANQRRTDGYGEEAQPVAASKDEIIKLVKSEVTIIVHLIHTLVGEVIELLSGTVKIVEEEKTAIVGLVLELIFEILFTLKKVLAVVGISIFELLGPLVFALISVIVHLLCVLEVLVDGLLKLVLGLLGGVIGLLLEVLKGLLPIILGLVGGILEKVGLVSLVCNLL